MNTNKVIREAFLEWLNSDNVARFGGGYRAQCNQYAQKYTLLGIYRYFIREYGPTIEEWEPKV